VFSQPADPSDPPTTSALVAKLNGDVGPAKIIQYAPGEVQNLPGCQGAIFVLQLNADALASDQGPLTDAMNIVDDQTTHRGLSQWADRAAETNTLRGAPSSSPSGALRP
jgi:hypothetical protein